MCRCGAAGESGEEAESLPDAHLQVGAVTMRHRQEEHLLLLLLLLPHPEESESRGEAVSCAFVSRNLHNQMRRGLMTVEAVIWRE